MSQGSWDLESCAQEGRAESWMAWPNTGLTSRGGTMWVTEVSLDVKNSVQHPGDGTSSSTS